VHQALTNAKSAPAITLLPKVLARVPVLLFAGDQDFICNYVGIESMVHEMEWNGAKGLGVNPKSGVSQETMLTNNTF
jgi:carboxypeptidase D